MGYLAKSCVKSDRPEATAAGENPNCWPWGLGQNMVAGSGVGRTERGTVWGMDCHFLRVQVRWARGVWVVG